MPDYKVIGTTFSIGPGLNLGDHHGVIVASRDAFYLYVTLRPSEVLAGSLAGVAGGLAWKSIRSFFKQQPKVMEFDLEDLPAEIKEHPDWPIKRGTGPIFVIPRDVIDRIHYGVWSAYDLVCGDYVYSIGLKFFTRRSVLAYLTEKGWDEKLDRTGSPSVLVQLAPFWCLLAGTAIGYGIGVALGAPQAGRGAAIEYGAFGAIGGLLTGGAIQYIAQKR